MGSLLSFLSGKVTLEKGGKGLAGGKFPREERKRREGLLLRRRAEPVTPIATLR